MSIVGPLKRAQIDATHAVNGNGSKVRLFTGGNPSYSSQVDGLSISEIRRQFLQFAKLFQEGSVHLRGAFPDIVQDSQAEEANLENLILMARVLKESLKAKRENTPEGEWLMD